MSWPFLAVVFSGWLYVDAAYRGPGWQRWLFKPLTLLLLFLLAWQAPEKGIIGYAILAGLIATLVADCLLMWSASRILWACVAFSVSTLLYAASFIAQMSFNLLFWPLPLALVVFGVLTLAVIWTRLEELRWPVVIQVILSALLCGIAGELYLQQGTDLAFSLLIGSVLLLLAHAIGLINRFRFPFRAADALVAACYFIGHFLIVRSLYI